MVLFGNRAKQVNGYGKKSSMKNYIFGDVIWNTNERVLQVYAGSKWHDISTRTIAGLNATGCVGNLTVSSGNPA
jgi:hypothetical protein